MFFDSITNYKYACFVVFLGFLCGNAGVVKRAWLRSKWLSAYRGSNPLPRILKRAFESIK